MKESERKKTQLILGAFIAAGLIFAAKLYAVQILHGDEFSARAERQYAQPEQTLWNRGSIFFSAKGGEAVSAAGLREGFTIAMVPKQMTEPEAAFDALAPFLEVSREKFLAQANRQDDPYEEIARRVLPETARAIEKMGTPGISLYRDRWRFYPGGKLAAHLLGFVGFQGDEFGGRYGLERYYDDALRRRPGSLYDNFFAELFSGVREAATGAVESAGDIVSSIEPTAQSFLEETLRALREKFGAAQGGGIIMEPQSGAIFALAAAPTFDPNDFRAENDTAIFSNPLVESVFEMGSIIKPLTLAAGLDAGVISATSTYRDRGFLTLDGKTISNFDGKGRGTVPIQEVLNQSLNTGAATVALWLGHARFRDYMLRFGLGEETGIDLPGESAGLTDNLKSGRDIEIATASYGQGIALTPIQTIRALAALANGGKIVTPHIATKINYRLGVSRRIGDGGAPKQVIAQKSAEEITRMLVRVVDEALLSGAYRLEHWSVAAKTGTGLIAKPSGGGYYTDRFFHSFFGYFPAYEPRFIVFLFLNEPQGVVYASHTLTEPFMEIAKFLINYYEIPPDRCHCAALFHRSCIS